MEFIKYSAHSLPSVKLTGSVAIPAPNCHFKRKPTEYIIYFVTKGFMTIKEDKETYHLKKGDILILDPSRTHNGIAEDSGIEYHYVHFTAENISVISGDEDSVSEILLQNKMDSSADDILIIPKYMNVLSNYKQLLNQMILLTSGFSCKSDYYRTKTSLRLIELLTNLSLSYSETSSTAASKNLTVIKLINFIHENCRTNISSDEIEKYFNMNFDYMNRIFKQQTGTTIMNYSNRYRIAESRKLLNSGMYNVKQTAEIMGFSNEFYFSRVYKKFEGSSPSEYREK